MHPTPTILMAGAAALLLFGCAISDDNLARILVAPEKFSTYACADLAVKAKELAIRERELKSLMAEAGTDAGGQLVSAAAYRPDYLAVHGEMMEVRRTAAEKKCDLLPDAGNGAASGAAALPLPQR